MLQSESGGGAGDRERVLARLRESALACRSCELCLTRTQVVFGAGAHDASVMLIGEAPGSEEDRTGLPFVGRSGRLLGDLLLEAGISRDDVYIANVIKCRPPGNRDPKREEIEACSDWLEAQVEAVGPKVLCTVGNFATKLVRGDPAGITTVHGRAEVRTVFGRTLRVYPLFHPAAALRSRALLDLLRQDVLGIPELARLPLP